MLKAMLIVAMAMCIPWPAAAAVRMQLVHAAPVSEIIANTRLVVRVNGSEVAPNFTYGTLVPYFDIGGTGNYTIELLFPGSTTPVVVGNRSFQDGERFTALAIGNNVNQPLGLLVAVDTASSPPGNSGWVRYFHVAANGANVSVRSQAGAAIQGFESLPYGAPSGYLATAAGTYDLKITTTDGVTTLADQAPFDVVSGSTSNFVFAGDGVRQPYAVFALPDDVATGGGTVDASVTGAWTTGPATGQGIALFPLPAERRLVGTWYTYGTGSALQWYTMDTCGTPVGQAGCTNPEAFDNRTANLTVYAVSGGTFLGTGAVTTRVAGTLSITFSSCTQANAAYNVDGRSGTFAMANLTPPANCTITAP